LRSREELKKSEQRRYRDERKRKREMQTEKSQGHGGQTMSCPGGRAVSGDDPMSDSRGEGQQLRREI
jgi:hypothetical protein